ncbi:MAG: AAA family ATPase [Coriobacteriales bacterium]|nr:AAA family ATPase [Coriobacteriales bacterium]
MKKTVAKTSTELFTKKFIEELIPASNKIEVVHVLLDYLFHEIPNREINCPQRLYNRVFKQAKSLLSSLILYASEVYPYINQWSFAYLRKLAIYSIPYFNDNLINLSRLKHKSMYSTPLFRTKQFSEMDLKILSVICGRDIVHKSAKDYFENYNIKLGKRYPGQYERCLIFDEMVSQNYYGSYNAYLEGIGVSHLDSRPNLISRVYGIRNVCVRDYLEFKAASSLDQLRACEYVINVLLFVERHPNFFKNTYTNKSKLYLPAYTYCNQSMKSYFAYVNHQINGSIKIKGLIKELPKDNHMLIKSCADSIGLDAGDVSNYWIDSNQYAADAGVNADENFADNGARADFINIILSKDEYERCVINGNGKSFIESWVLKENEESLFFCKADTNEDFDLQINCNSYLKKKPAIEDVGNSLTHEKLEQFAKENFVPVYDEVKSQDVMATNPAKEELEIELEEKDILTPKERMERLAEALPVCKPEDPKDEYTSKKLNKKLDKYVVGQQEARLQILDYICMSLQRMKKINEGIDEQDLPDKRALLLAGPTASGKTHILKTIAKTVDMGFFSIEMTKVTGVGWKGISFDTYLAGLARFQSENPNKPAILFIDEFDKCSQGTLEAVEHPSFNSQNSLLKFLDGGLYHGTLERRDDAPFTINTNNVFIILAGAFTDIGKKIVEKRLNSKNGFGFDGMPAYNKEENTLRKEIQICDIKEWGIKDELIGRISQIVYMDALTVEDLKVIVNGCDFSSNLQSRYAHFFDDVKIEITDDAAELAANRCLKDGLGARELDGIFAPVFQKIYQELCENEYKKVKVVADGEHLTYIGSH